MVQLMQLLTDCFPRIVCKTKDAMQEHLERLLSADTQQPAAAGDAMACTAAAEEPTVCSNNSGDVNNSTVGGTSSLLQCHLCVKSGRASRATALHAHLNTHPAFRCKKCKFVCMSHAEQKEHQRVEHGLDDEATANSSQLPYCVSSALEVQYDMLRACFPLQNRQQQQSHSAPPPGEHAATADASAAVSPPAAGAAKRRRKTLQPDDSASAACGGKRKRNKKCSTASSIEG
ncbi:hypothetical protein niasHT_034947 [Heterodera trifolii]|uniref:C2H2-type domain-containing protein n=1 Tax=Heterodera trifolii TaxID=157864 RepID=A0ABD2I7L6_9BILA